MAWPFISGEILTAANLDAVTRPNNAVCQVTQTAVQNLTNNTLTLVTFDTDDVDPIGWHSTSSLTERIIPTITGWYQVFAAFEFSGDSDYTRTFMDIQKNAASSGTPGNRFDDINPGTSAAVRAVAISSTMISLNGTTDYINLSTLQANTSAATNTIRARLCVRLVYPT